MQILISDANILIDMEVAELTQLMFRLPYQFKIPDMLFEYELRQQHDYLLDYGLQMAELTADSMMMAYQLNEKYSQPSLNDIFALMLAKQENCPLLTGDGQLRKSAKKEAVIVMGTIWVVEQLAIHKLIDKTQAMQAYDDMENSGRRLPFKDARDRIRDMEL